MTNVKKTTTNIKKTPTVDIKKNFDKYKKTCDK